MRSVFLARTMILALLVTGVNAFGAEFRAGAGKSEIQTSPDMLPVEGYTVVHDQAAVRVLLMDDGKSRFAIVSVETPSISEAVISAAKEAMKKAANVATENTLVTATHSTAAPHISLGSGPGGAPGGNTAQGGGPGGSAPGGGAPGGGNAAQSGGPGGQSGPGGMSGPGATLYAKAFQAALEAAAQQAASSLQPAKLGFGVGATDINVSRDLPTPKGYAQGSYSAGYSDRTLPVVRIDKADGKPLALLINPAVRSVFLADSTDKNGGKELSSDLAGATSRYIEKWYGGNTVALFMMGAGVDQAPMLEAARRVLGPDGSMTTIDIHEAAFTLLDMLGERLGSDAILASESVKASTQPTVEVLRGSLKVPSQARSFGPPPGESAQVAAGIGALPTPGQGGGANAGPGGGPNAGQGAAPGAAPSGGGGNASSNGPVLSYTYKQGPEIDFAVIVMRIGDIAIAGIAPELSSIIGNQIKTGSPYPNTMVATMVDGNAKYIVDEQSFDHFTAEARGSQYARGAAEQVATYINNLLKEMKAGK